MPFALGGSEVTVGRRAGNGGITRWDVSVYACDVDRCSTGGSVHQRWGRAVIVSGGGPDGVSPHDDGGVKRDGG